MANPIIKTSKCSSEGRIVALMFTKSQRGSHSGYWGFPLSGNCWNFSAFDFHPTLPGMLGPTLIRHQVVQMRQPREKRLLAPFGMMEAFHGKQFPLNGVMGLV
jgi:hypothetical protein